jgi:Peptidase family M28
MTGGTSKRRSSARPGGVLEEIEVETVWRLMSRMALGERVSGAPAESEALTFAARYLAAAGLAVRRHEYRSLIGLPAVAALRVTSPEVVEVPCTSYSMAPGTPEGGMSAELVWAGADNRAFGEPTIRGRIALCDGIGSAPRTVMADRSDALAVISIDEERVHEMCISPVRGTPTPRTRALLPRLPQVGVSRDDGARLRSLLAQGRVTVHLDVRPVLEWRSIPVLVGDVIAPGTEEFVLLSGHADSWYSGAHDNATGNAAVLAIAALMQSRAGELRRGVRVALWSGHSHGRYSGSTWYADDQWDDLYRRCVAHVEIDSVGGLGADVVSKAPTMAETYEFGREVVRASTGADLEYHRVELAGDMPSFWGMGVPSLFGNFSFQPDTPESVPGPVGIYGWWWHRPEDTTDKVDREYLLRDVRAHALAVWELCTRELLPFRYSAAVREIRDAVEQAIVTADPAVDLTALLRICDELAAAIDALEQRFGQLQEEHEYETANAILRQLGRHLVPVNHKGTPSWEHDLALPARPVPGLAAILQLDDRSRADAGYEYALVEALRQRNRLTSELRAALAVAERALAPGGFPQ